MTCLCSKAQKNSAAALQLFVPAGLVLGWKQRPPTDASVLLGGHLGSEFNVWRPEVDFFLVPICLTCQNAFPAGITVKLESACDNFYWHPSGSGGLAQGHRPLFALDQLPAQCEQHIQLTELPEVHWRCI